MRRARGRPSGHGKLDGSASDVDGNGRAASDADALTALVWVLFQDAALDRLDRADRPGSPGGARSWFDRLTMSGEKFRSP